MTTREKVSGFEWEEAEYQLELSIKLPEFVEMKKKEYAAQHPDKPFFRLLFAEKPRGNYYRLGFGEEMDGYYFDVEAE